MTNDQIGKKRSLFQRVAPFGAVAALVAAAFTAGHALAAGIPAHSALTYGGTLQAADGTPLTGKHTIEVRFWSAASGGSTLCTSGEQTGVSLTQGRFSVALPDDCTTAVSGTADTYVEVVLDETSLGRSKTGAVPYAVEAGHAMLATDVTTGGTLDQRLATLETALANVIPSGTVSAFAGPQAPQGWLLCDGSAVSRSTYPALFAIISTTWGAGDGATTFNLPDLRGRTPIGAGQAAGLSARALGQALGEETHTLTIAEMPAHTHSLTTVPGTDTANGYAGGGYFGDPIPQDTSATGGNQPHNNMQPSAVVNYLIKY